MRSFSPGSGFTVLSRGRRAWLPALLVPALVAAGALVAGAQQSRTVDLPERTAEQVLELVAGSQVRALSGTVQQTSDLGLPQLPDGATGRTGAMALDLLTGSHTLRVFLDGPQRARMQVLDTLAERDVVRDGRDVWLYDSQSDEATHLVLPAEPHGASSDRSADDHPGPPSLDGQPLTPQSLARKLLDAAAPSTEVTVGDDALVAGRTAYQVVLEPRTAATLVGRITMAVDSGTGLPLRVRVEARGQQEPAFEIAYTQLTLERPDADLFRFTPPSGATVHERTLTPPAVAPDHRHYGPGGSESPHPTVTGTGWDAVVQLPAGSLPTALRYSPVLRQATLAVREGRALTTALVTVLITDDGRVLAGAVPLERLQAVAAER